MGDLALPGVGSPGVFSSVGLPHPDVVPFVYGRRAVVAGENTGFVLELFCRQLTVLSP